MARLRAARTVRGACGADARELRALIGRLKVSAARLRERVQDHWH
jgi:hypothetical protein